MKNEYLLALALAFLPAISRAFAATDSIPSDDRFLLRMIDEVNTFTGSAPSITQTAGLFGKKTEEWGQTLPAVLTPYGMNFWTPQTRDTERKCIAPFYYNDTTMQGFRCSHWIVGGCTQDYGSFTLCLMADSLRPQPEQRATPFSHDNEASHPYYYAVALPREHLQAEMTATCRAAIFRFTAQESGLYYLVVNPNSDEGEGRVTIDAANHCLTASNPVHRIYQGWGESAGFSGHFSLQFQKEPEGYGVFDDQKVYPRQSAIANEERVGGWLCFRLEAGEQLLVRAACSFTDVTGAMRNLSAELPHWDFDRACLDLRQQWLERFRLLEVGGDALLNETFSGSGERGARSENTEQARINNLSLHAPRSTLLDNNYPRSSLPAPRSSTNNDGASLLHKFYGALYRASFLPHAISDADGRYPAFAQPTPTILQLPPGETQYGDYSMWDTYRAVHPLINILTPEVGGEMMQSLVRMYQQGGWLPIFPCWNSYTAAMIGDHCASVLADAWVKGIRNFDLPTAYKAMRQNAFSSPATQKEYRNGMGRRALKSYLRYGYIPLEDSVPDAFHRREQVSRTLEYAYDDFCVAQVAKALGHADDYRELMRRSENWRNAINPLTGYAQGRLADGRFGGDADPFKRQSYITEGAPCHYTWYVPHNPEGLISLMGGREAFVARLDSMFTCGRYWHGNEPCHQVAYLFNAAGQPWRTQQYVRKIIDTEYLDAPGGLSGNDDAGQMSAWLLFACMGFYPVCPGTPYYYIGSPVFPLLTIHLPQGRRFSIVCEQSSPRNIYIQSMMLNGKPLIEPFLSHDDIMRGGELRCVMGDRPPVK